MEKKIYILICQNEDQEIVSMEASHNINTLRAKMEEEWDAEVESFLAGGYEEADNEDVSWIKENFAIAGTSRDEDGLFYSWEIKAVEGI